MPNTASAARRARQSIRRHQRNKSVKSRLKTLEKNYLAAVAAGNKEAADLALRRVSSALDRAAKVGVIPKPRAQRKRSRLHQRLNTLK